MKTLLFILLICISAHAVEATGINDQFKELKESSETFKEYKVIKINVLNDFWKSVMDSIKTKESVIAKLQSENSVDKANIDQLKANLEVRDATIEELQYATSHINVLGVEFGKTFYKILNFTIIGILLVFCGILIISLKERRNIAKTKISAFDKLELKFEDYKRAALDKQMKLRRELQTEINKREQKRSI
ncbi:MAG TPA: hypothetical protein PKL31_11265 [Fulvivirga sp.]|nr:hypothetical protein [Fulvivirga sp.]